MEHRVFQVVIVQFNMAYHGGKREVDIMYQKNVEMLLKELLNHRKEVISVLNKIESMETATDEFECAVDCLEMAHLEKKYWGGNNIHIFASFMPVNLPLYSLILGLMSSLAAEETYIRPSTDTKDIVNEINQILHTEVLFPHFHIRNDDRQTFLDNYVKEADAVYFVGEFGNAKKVQAEAKPNALFLYSGTGMNPLIVAEDADISLSVKKALQAGLYNSGQDCGRPKVHLVHESVADVFLNELKHSLDEVICDDFSNPDARIVPILRDSVIEDTMKFLLKHRDKIYRGVDSHSGGGNVDLVRKIIYPTILKVDINHKAVYKEFFAPIFTVATYKSDAELKSYFKEDRYYHNAMYAFVFGNLPEGLDLSKHTVVIHNASLLDVDQGNQRFGGYGKRANYIFDGRNHEARPFLVSEELYRFGQKRRRKMSA